MTTTENKWFYVVARGQKIGTLVIPIVTQRFEAAIRIAQHRRRPLDGEWQLLLGSRYPEPEPSLRGLQPGE